MSDQEQALADFEKSAQYLNEQYFVPAFFEKLASLGIEPETEAEAVQLLQLGTILQQSVASHSGATQSLSNPLLEGALQKAASEAGYEAYDDNFDEELLNQSYGLVQADENTKAAALNYLGGLAQLVEAEAAEQEES